MRRVKAVLTVLACLCVLFCLGLLLPTVGWLAIGAGIAILGCLAVPPAPIKG